MGKMKWLLMLALCLTGLTLTGCASGGSSADEDEEEVAEEKPKLPIPPDSPFAKVQENMGMQEVNDLIGRPTSTSTYMTGKGFNPFYYGGDTHRTVAHYKGIGRITYTQNSRYSSGDHVEDIEYDPTETGYERND
jgi:hypothetical protein